MGTMTREVQSVAKRLLFGLAAILFVVTMPASYVFADSVDGSTPSSNTCTPVTAAPGITKPTGSDSVTYTYNSCTGLWENAYYTWSPVTKVATPKTPYVYTCNTSTWKWMTEQWVYSPGLSKFVQVPITVSQLPAGASIASSSLSDCTAPPPVTSPTANSTIANTGPDSTNSVIAGTGSDATLNATNNATLTNLLNSSALSGSANVTGNTLGGNASTGNAQAIANIVNAVQSQSALGGDTVTFVANIPGNVQGDLVINPNLLQPANSTSTLSGPTDLTINTDNNGQINNTVNLNAASGDATVAQNTTGGSATSGDAEAIANVVNMLNSVIGAGKSFVGVINIDGNLNGNILMPQSFLDSLIASNAPSTTIDLPESAINNLGINNTNNQAVNNTVSSSATSGQATVSGNSSAGSATTGKASTQVTVFNLTGQNVVAANCLLVFVNVSGTWVGVLMNAPAGTTAAAFGSGVTGNTVNDASVNNVNNNAITNDINLSAASGDAIVDKNTQAGDATSGKADTAANLLNLNNSQLNVSGWFGILFVNIFGNWYGNFGVYTPPAPNNTPAGPGPNPAASPAAGTPPPVFQFIPPTPAANSTTENNDVPLTTVSAHLASKAGHVLGNGMANAGQNVSASKTANYQFQAIGGALAVLGLGTMAVERYLSTRRHHTGA